MKKIVYLFLFLVHWHVQAQEVENSTKIDLTPTPKGFVIVPSGSFTIAERFENIFDLPVQKKTISISMFFLKTTEVTNLEYKEFVKWVSDSLGLDNPTFAQQVLYNGINIMPDTTVWQPMLGDNGFNLAYSSYFTNPVYDDYPIVGVTYDQAKAYCDWKTATDGTHIYHLPTEAQWEYAACWTDTRKRNKFPWPGEDCSTLVGFKTANYKIKEGVYLGYGSGEILYTQRVMEYFENDLGLFDMGGNVAEWCLDSFDWKYPDQDRDIVNLKESDLKVVRGGSWKDPWYFMQCSARSYANKNTPKNYIGFRVAAILVGSVSRHEFLQKYKQKQ